MSTTKQKKIKPKLDLGYDPPLGRCRNMELRVRALYNSFALLRLQRQIKEEQKAAKENPKVITELPTPHAFSPFQFYKWIAGNPIYADDVRIFHSFAWYKLLDRVEEKVLQRAVQTCDRLMVLVDMLRKALYDSLHKKFVYQQVLQYRPRKVTDVCFTFKKE